MKYFIVILGILAVSSLTIGLIGSTDYSEKLIGFGVLGLFFVVFPLFAWHRWKDKNVKDYMLTKENIEKMRKNQEDKKI